jgi:hypothetical protein
VRLPEYRRLFQQHERLLERGLRRDRPKLFRALEEFANIRSDKEGWAQFKSRWPDFFPSEEYERAVQGLKPSILDYPYWLNQIWMGGETNPYLRILLGIETAPGAEEEGTPEDSWIVGLSSMPAKFDAEWGEGVFTYEGACDFQRALYWLFRESWRARFCEKCDAKFIARRTAQKYCSTDCSENMQRQLKRRWWAEHGETWRRERRPSKSKRKAAQNGTRKTR